jgi:hypothetical protein
MDYKTWKETKDNNTSTSYERLETLKKQYGFEVVEEKMCTEKSIVGGICQSPSCGNNYNKQFRSMNTTGPYCDECAGIKRRGLLIDEFPEIAKSIVSDIDLSKITSCSALKVNFQCDKSCSRCKQNHIWNTMISNRVNGNGCAMCANFLNCECVDEAIEFCCYKCREIKPLQEKCVSFKTAIQLYTKNNANRSTKKRRPNI